MLFRTTSIFGLAFLVALAQAQNLLQNPGFETWGSNDNGGYTFTQTGVGFSGCGADGWNFYNFVSGTTTSARTTPPGGLSGSGNYSIYITADTAGNGVGQTTEIGQTGLPDTYNFVSGWVYVTQGSAGIAWFNQDTYLSTVVASTSTHNQWVFLSAYLPAVQADSFEVLATSANSDFYADNMDAEPTPEPTSFALLGLGALALLARRRRRAKA